MPELGQGNPAVLGSLDKDFPLLMEKARAYDFAERLGGCTDPLMAEIDKAMRELWDARAYLRDEPNRV
jgi:hypothetical protein